MSRTHRLFELIGILRANRMPVTADHLARELGISPRSVYRDIETLRSSGAAIDGQAGMGYCLREGFFLPQFAFSPGELEALIHGLNWVQQKADPKLAKCSASALAKIVATAKGGPLTDGANPSLVAASTSVRRDDPHVSLLRDAIRRQRKITISYQDAEGALSDRTVWPIIIVYFDDVRILATWCETRSAFRHFRVDRLRVKTILEEPYPERRPILIRRWQQQDRDWRSLLTKSDAPH